MLGSTRQRYLVKGLDYVLLRKIREKEKADKDVEEEEVTSKAVPIVFDSKNLH